MKKEKHRLPMDLLELAMESGGVSAWYRELDGHETPMRAENYERTIGLKHSASWSFSELIKHVHPQDRQKMELLNAELVSGRTPDFKFEYRIVDDKGELRWIEARGKSYRGPDGRIKGIAGVVRNVTEAKVLRATNEQFVATLTHDLRNPLAAAKANAQLIERFPDRVSDRSRLVRKVIAAIERADRIVQDLLDSTRAQARQPISFSSRQCDLGAVLSEMVNDLSEQYGDRFRFQVSGEFCGYWADELIRRMMENLVTNAVKYGVENRPIGIRLERNEKGATLSVHNEGDSIPLEDQLHLFEPFYRACSAQTEGRAGSGLGLSFVKSAADALHGRVTLESGPGVGTTFRVEFSESERTVARSA